MAANTDKISTPYTTKSSGDPNTTSWRMFYFKDGVPISPFHDIPLVADKEKGYYHMFVEIPRGSNAKLEVSLSDEFNPIKQDVKKGNLRFVHDVEPYQGYIWNYGAFPQTWEDPTHKDDRTGCLGDNDPLDVCEIGSATAKVGEVKVVKLLGVLALIDEGETDWKVITIDVNDPLAEKLNDISDVQKYLPGFSMATYEWFRTYKMPGGSPANEFAFDGECKDAKFAKQVVEDNYNFWKALHNGKKEPKTDKYNISVTNSQLGSSDSSLSKFTVDADKAKATVKLSDDQGHPTANTKPPGQPDNSVFQQVQHSQYTSPHATSILAHVAKDISNGVQQASKLTDSQEQVNAIVASLKSGNNVAAVNKEKVNADQSYSVFVSKNTFGVYQPKGPHSINSSLSGDVASAGFDHVAAGYFNINSGSATFYWNAGPKGLLFASENGAAFSLSSDKAQSPNASDSDDLLSVRAPLSLLASL